MRWLLLAPVALLLWRHVRRPRRDVSRDWLVDSDRRQWGSGVDLPCWKWPVKP